MRHNLKAQLLVSTITFGQLPTRAVRRMSECEREKLKAVGISKKYRYDIKYLLFMKLTKNKREATTDFRTTTSFIHSVLSLLSLLLLLLMLS